MNTHVYMCIYIYINISLFLSLYVHIYINRGLHKKPSKCQVHPHSVRLGMQEAALCVSELCAVE